jgi:nitrate/nitrite transport system ATP-binding protein
VIERPLLSLEGASKRFGDHEVLKDVNLAIRRGEFVAIVGFSGAGKTTLVSLLAGLLRPDSGGAIFDGREISGPGPERAVIFQTYSLFPWMTVLENVLLAVDQVFPSWSAAQRREHAEKYLAMVKLSAALAKRPHELSGGMRQRVAVARALAMDPKVLLMDEPLGALDALTRAVLQSEIERIWLRDRKTALLITNDVDEAVLLADRIIPLSAGPSATLGESIEVDLDRPRDRSKLNRDPRFKEIRNRVLNYLLGSSAARRRGVAVAAEATA